jgi:hypothetical protein
VKTSTTDPKSCPGYGTDRSRGTRADGSDAIRKHAPARAGKELVVRSALAPLLSVLLIGAAGPENAKSPLGTNLSEMRDWSTEWSLVDTFKQSREWFSGSKNEWEDRRELDLDENGWVRSLKDGQAARTLMFWAKGLPYPAGDYVVLYEGEGKLHYTPNVRVISSAPGREVIRPDTQQSGLGLGINQTNPKNYIRNIRVLLPGGSCAKDAFKWCKNDADCGKDSCVPFEKNYAQQVFHPIFLDRIRKYGTLRFMNWQNIDYEPKQVGWETRPKTTDARFVAKGVPVEIMVELANRIGADAWFSMPHSATDEYMTEFAKYVHDHLDKGSKAYVEHSNEVWNLEYEQARFARQKGLSLKLASNEVEAQIKWHSKRSVEIFKIWEKVFGGTDRLVRVMGSWAQNPLVSEGALSYGEASKHTDALAIAPYFGIQFARPTDLARTEAMTVDSLFDTIKGELLPQAVSEMKEQAKIAKKHNVELIAYEGGQHLIGVGAARENDRINMLFDRVNRDPKMKPIYLDYLKAWKDAGGHLFVHYTHCRPPSKYGRFGSLEMLDQAKSAAPKYEALQEFIEKNPRWW